MIRWRPLGHIYKTTNYGQTPTPLVLDDRVRVYFAERYRGQSFIRFVDLDINDPTKIIGEPSARVLENGALGAFDSCGQMPSFAERTEHIVDLYYSGWLAPAGDVPYHNATGIARSVDGGLTFMRLHAGPILDRTPLEPYLAVTPCIVGDRMWYIIGLRWEWLTGRYEPIYGIVEFEVARRGLLVIPQSHKHECFSRPYVLHVGDEWKMWYCHRSALDYRDGLNSYRIGYATSKDGWTWTRRDDEMQLPRSDFDSTMQCYASVFEAKDKTYLLYNGNTFGKHGFGIAVQE